MKFTVFIFFIATQLIYAKSNPKKEHRKFCEESYENYIFSTYSRQNTNKLYEGLKYYIEGEEEYAVTYEGKQNFYRGCIQKIDWMEDVRNFYCDRSDPITANRDKRPDLKNLPNLFLFFFDGMGDFNADLAKHYLEAVNISGDEGKDLGMGHFNGGHFLYGALGNEKEVVPEKTEIHYHASSGLHSEENFFFGTKCLKEIDRYLDFVEKKSPKDLPIKFASIGYSNGAVNALKFQNTFKRIKRDLSLVFTVDPIPQAIAYFPSKLKSYMGRKKESVTQRLVNFYQRDDFGSVPYLKLRGLPVDNADENIRVSAMQDNYMNDDGDFAHVEILKSDGIQERLQCELKRIFDTSLICN